MLFNESGALVVLLACVGIATWLVLDTCRTCKACRALGTNVVMPTMARVLVAFDGSDEGELRIVACDEAGDPVVWEASDGLRNVCRRMLLSEVSGLGCAEWSVDERWSDNGDHCRLHVWIRR